jgi:hypothetical protein
LELFGRFWIEAKGIQKQKCHKTVFVKSHCRKLFFEKTHMPRKKRSSTTPFTKILKRSRCFACGQDCSGYEPAVQWVMSSSKCQRAREHEKATGHWGCRVSTTRLADSGPDARGLDKPVRSTDPLRASAQAWLIARLIARLISNASNAATM